MDKNTITGFILIAIVLIGFSWWQQPSAEQIEAQRKQDSIAVVAREKAEKERKAAEAAKKNEEAKAREDSTAAFFQAMNGTAQDVVLKNEKVVLTLSTKGGTVKKAVLKDFKNREGKNEVTLFDEKDQQLKFMLAGKETNIISSELYFTPTNLTDSTVTMTADRPAGDGLAVGARLYAAHEDAGRGHGGHVCAQLLADGH